MNIKYRLLCKRLIEERKRVGVIQYYNVLFIMELVSDKDIWSLEQWVNGINNIYMKDIHNWCRTHFVKYHTVFVYRKEYPVKANIWNGYSYIRRHNKFILLIVGTWIGILIGGYILGVSSILEALKIIISLAILEILIMYVVLKKIESNEILSVLKTK